MGSLKSRHTSSTTSNDPALAIAGFCGGPSSPPLALLPIGAVRPSASGTVISPGASRPTGGAVLPSDASLPTGALLSTGASVLR